jgi:hypothetical protein
VVWFLVLVGFLCSWQDSTLERLRRRRDRRLCHWRNDFGVLQFFSFFKTKSTLFRCPLVDTHPLVVLVVVLRFCRCVIRPERSPVTGAWSSRARVFSTSWAARDGYVPPLLPCLVAIGSLWCSAAAGDLLAQARVLHAPPPAVLLPTSASVFWCYLVLDFRLYLTVCSGVDLA